MTDELKQLAVERLYEAPFHFRSTRANWPTFVASIRDHGIIVALVVRARPRAQGGYEVLDGWCRREAAAEVGLTKAPCIVVDVDDATAISMQIDANGNRADLHPVDEAGVFSALEGIGWDVKAIAKRFKRKPVQVIQRLKLTALSIKAKAAFVAGVIDEAGALALARLGADARQNAYVDAIKAGTLQSEELAGRVAREHSAPLEDVPWGAADEAHVAKAGPCTTCTKRTAAQRLLFADMSGDRCLDVACWGKKMARSFEIEATAAGVEVLTLRADALFLPVAEGRPKLLGSSGMVEADRLCPYVNGKTWQEAIGAAEPKTPPVLYVAKDQDGRPRLLFSDDAVTKLVRRSAPAKEQRAAAAAADPMKPDDADERKEEKRKRRALLSDVLENAPAVLAGGPLTMWPWVASRIVAGAGSRTQQWVADRVGVQADAGTSPGAALAAVCARGPGDAIKVALLVLIREADDDDDVPALKLLRALVREVDGALEVPADAPEATEAA